MVKSQYLIGTEQRILKQITNRMLSAFLVEMEVRIMDKKVIDVYENKENVTQVSRLYIFFTFSDGSQGTKKINKDDLKMLHEWIVGELKFYHRMYEELHNSYEKQKEKFNKSRHFYSDDEIQKACLKDRFANIHMENSNREYMREWNKIVGIGNESSRINDKYWKLYTLKEQIKNTYDNIK